MPEIDKPYVPGSLAASLTDTSVPVAVPVVTEEKPVKQTVLTKRKRKVEGISFESGLTFGKNRAKEFRLSKEEKESKDNKTVFVGNVPLAVTRKELSTFFKRAGPVESVRIRSVAIEGTKISNQKDLKLNRRASYILGKVNAQVKDTVNAYVVFKSADSVPAAVDFNGTVFQGHHLRVDYISQKASTAVGSHKKTIFVGNLPFETNEEKLRKFVALSVSGGDECILNVRIVRDKVTNKGKGFAYVLFSERGFAKEATLLKGATFEGRQLRISKVDPNFKETQKLKAMKSHAQSRGTDSEDTLKTEHHTKDSKFQGETAKFGAYMRIKKKRGETSSLLRNRRHPYGKGPGKKPFQKKKKKQSAAHAKKSTPYGGTSRNKGATGRTLKAR